MNTLKESSTGFLKRRYQGLSTNTSEQAFSTYCPDLQEFIHSLYLLDENVNKAVINGMHKGADIVINEQKRLISNHPRLVKYITKGKLKVSRKGNISIDCGYNEEAFNTVEGKTNIGVYGASVEFGRPGKGSRSKSTMKQTRYGREVEVKKGFIQPQSHIIRGFENKIGEAINTVINSVDSELKKFGD